VPPAADDGWVTVHDDRDDRPAPPPVDDPLVAPYVRPGLVVDMRDVTRHFGAVKALTNLFIAVPEGRITVLLGPNGAGKTTAIRMITGALSPETGTVRVFGLDPGEDGEAVRTRCGVVSAKPALYDRLSGRANLSYAAELYGMGRGADDKIRAAAARFGIEHALDQQVGGYSTGMKTRLALSRSVLHDPALLLYDEPTSGLDPESSHAVLELIREMTAEGRTVVMCTHLLVEAEGLADQVVVMESGTDLLTGTQQDLTEQFFSSNLVRVEAEEPTDLDRLADLPGVLHYTRTDEPPEGAPTGWKQGMAELQRDARQRVPDLVFALTEAGVRVTRVEPYSPSLEDLYFEVRRRRRAVGVELDL
jgi:ABC-type multidrug transport system ATPase subunit